LNSAELNNCCEKKVDHIEFTVQINILKTKPVRSEAMQSAECCEFL